MLFSCTLFLIGLLLFLLLFYIIFRDWTSWLGGLVSLIVPGLVVLFVYFSFFMPTVFAEGVEGTFPVLHEWTKLTHPDTILDIKTTLSNKAGIYRFTCLETGGTYIGSSVDLYARFNAHLNSETLSNICLQRSFAKHGLEAFSFSVVEFCDPSVLLAREQVWLDHLFSTFAAALIYNIARDALAPMLGRSHTAESKAAIGATNSKALKGNTNRVGTTQSEETKAAISSAQKGENNSFFGKSHSDATKAAMSEAQKGEKNHASKPVYVYDSKNLLVGTFPSHTAAAAFLGISQVHVGRLVKTGSSTRKGYRVTTTLLS